MKQTEQENLQKLARELSQKNSWIRKCTEKLMGKWSHLSQCGEALQSSAITIAENNEKFYLSSGNSEIQYWNGYEWSDGRKMKT